MYQLDLSPPAVNGFAMHNGTAERAFEILKAALERWGNTLSEDHAATLRALQYTYIHTALGVNPQGRTAWPLSVGAGKTASVAAFAAAISERRQKDISIIVAQNRVESLIRLKATMVELGVPREDIALVHSKRYSPEHAEACRRLEGPDGFASEPSLPADADPSRYPILLLSHELLKARADIWQFFPYRGEQRSLVIWDESLVKSAGRTMSLTDIEAAVAALEVHLKWADKAHPEAREALRFTQGALELLHAELQAQREEGRSARAIRLPELNGSTLHAWVAGLRELSTIKRGPTATARKEDGNTVYAFLRHMVNEPLRVVSAPTGAVIMADLVIPPELQRVVVLDASHCIRELVSRFDASVSVVDSTVHVKSFENVRACQLRHGGGRSTVDAALRAKDSSLLRAIVERIATYPEDKSVLLFTYKHGRIKGTRNGDLSHREIIEEALRDAGIDPDATLPNGKARFRWLTWGQELGLSDYSDCEHVMLVGIYRQSHQAYAGAIAGQLEDLTAPEAGDSKVLREVEVSEVFHALYQAMGRGRCRETRAGRAEPMQLDYIGVEDFPEAYWQAATPGIQRENWTSSHLAPLEVVKGASKAILEALQRLPERVDYVSCRVLKAQAGLQKVPKKSFHRARLAAEGRLSGWVYLAEKRGYQRCPFV